MVANVEDIDHIDGYAIRARSYCPTPSAVAAVMDTDGAAKVEADKYESAPLPSPAAPAAGVWCGL